RSGPRRATHADPGGHGVGDAMRLDGGHGHSRGRTRWRSGPGGAAARSEYAGRDRRAAVVRSGPARAACRQREATRRTRIRCPPKCRPASRGVRFGRGNGRSPLARRRRVCRGRMTRIAYICMDQGVPVWGRTGSSIHVQEVIRAFRTLGADVELFAASADDDPPRDLAAVPVHRVPVAQEGPRAARERSAVAANRDLRAALEDEQPFDLVYERYSLWSFAGMDFAREAGISGVLEVNAPLIDQQAEYRGLVDRQGADRIAAQVFGASRVLVALSSAIADYLGRYRGTRGRVEIIPDGVNPDRFRLDCKPALPAAHRWSVGFVGSLKPLHGL